MSGAKLSKVAERLLWLDGQPFSLKDYPMYRAVYDGRYRSTLLMTARQVAKSTSLANFTITESVAIPFFKSYYLSPSKEQTLIFSNTRVGKTLSYSPLIKKYFQSSVHADRVLHRAYTNGSENAFTYANVDADRARGWSADRVCYDEMQDIVYKAVVPVVNECMANSKYKYETYAGTPKTMESSMQHLWEMSTQTEWVMKCGGCGKYNYVATEKSVGKHGPICLHCGHYLNPREGVWVDTHKPRADIIPIKGFHIPQLIMPLNVPAANRHSADAEFLAEERWADILHKLNTYGKTEFRNEVLGVSDAVGRRLLGLEELRALCTGPAASPTPNTSSMAGVSSVVAGIDWSGGGTKQTSRTVLWIWGFVPTQQKLRTLYFKIFPGNHAVEDVQEIARICMGYNVAMVVGDAGEGFLANATLRGILGHHRVTALRYQGSQKQPLIWNGVDQYHGNRTSLIDNYMMFLKRGAAILPPYEESKEAIQDILNVYEEVGTTGLRTWHVSPALSDDALHAQVFGWMAFKLLVGDLQFYMNMT